MPLLVITAWRLLLVKARIIWRQGLVSTRESGLCRFSPPILLIERIPSTSHFHFRSDEDTDEQANSHELYPISHVTA